MKKIIMAMTVLLVAGSVFAANNEWDGGGDGVSWNDGNNWGQANTVPTTTHTAIIRGADGAVSMSSTPATNPQNIWLANSGGAQKSLTIANSTVGTGTIRVGYDRGAWTADGVGNGLLTINSGSAVTATGNLEIGAKDGAGTAGATGLVILNDGTLSANQALVGKDASTTGTLTLNGGAATFTTLKLASNAASTGTLNLNGGTLDFTNWSGAGQDIINVSLGSMTAGADRTGRISGIAGAGDLAATGGLLDDSTFTSTYTSNSGSFTSGSYIAKWGYDSGTNKTALWAVAIPEPATLGMVVAFGGGMLFIRRRFMM
jgi:hypothetical protein